MKKIKLSLIVMVLITLMFAGCGGQDGDSGNQSSDDGSVQSGTRSVDNTQNDDEVVIEEYTDYELYVKIEAEVACDLIEAGESEDEMAIFNAMTKYKSLGEKYGFSEEEMQSMIDENKESEVFKNDVLREMMNVCPDIAGIDVQY